MATAEDYELNSSSTTETVFDGRVPCSPCEADGKRLEAVGFCVNCKEYLCETCFKYHRLPSLMRKHVLLDQEQMENDGAFHPRQHKCQIHPGRTIEYHCPTHSFLGCHVCFFRHQEICKDSKYIPDVSESFASSDEFKQFQARLSCLSTRAKNVIEDGKRKPESIDKRFTKNVETIKTFKAHVLEEVDKQEKELMKTAESLKRAEIMNTRGFVEKCTSIQEANQAISTETEVLENRGNGIDLYIHVVKSKDRLLSIEDQLNAAESDETSQLCTFEVNTDVLETVKSSNVLGNFLNLGVISSVTHVSDINVKTRKDRNSCSIRGSAMMPEGKLVIGDFHNKKVKLFDTKKNKVVSEMKLSNSPRSIAKVTDTTVAVSVTDVKTIVFVRTHPTLSVERKLDVKEECYGVAYCEGKLIITFQDKNKVQVMDLYGTVLCEIQTDDNEKPLFDLPLAVAVNPTRALMYVSSQRGNYISCLTLDGTLLATYEDDEFRTPVQATVDSTGVVFVNAYSSKTVHLVSANCRKIKVILTSDDGLDEPRTVSYDESDRKLFIGDENKIKVFRISYANV